MFLIYAYMCGFHPVHLMTFICSYIASICLVSVETVRRYITYLISDVRLSGSQWAIAVLEAALGVLSGKPIVMVACITRTSRNSTDLCPASDKDRLHLGDRTGAAKIDIFSSDELEAVEKRSCHTGRFSVWLIVTALNEGAPDCFAQHLICVHFLIKV